MEQGKRLSVEKFTSWLLLIYCGVLTGLALGIEIVSESQLGTTLSESGAFGMGRYVIGFAILAVVALFGHHLIRLLIQYPGWAFLSVVAVSGVKVFFTLKLEAYLFLPWLLVAMALLVYMCEGTGLVGLAACGVGCLVLVFLSGTMGGYFYMLALFLVVMTLLCYGTLTGWFGDKLRYFLATIGMGIVAVLAGAFWKMEYLFWSVDDWFHPELDPLGSGYRPLLMQSLLRESVWFGQGGLAQGLDDTTQYPFYETGFLSYLSNHFGLWVIIAVAALFLGFFYLCLRKAHPLYGVPRFLALAIIAYLMLQTIAFFAQNMGVPLFTSVQLPFISYSPHLWSNSLLCGLLLAAMGMKSDEFPR
ncbi:hypothetical protein RFF05_15715 [Bengtsoniella intestinalis]|uniref:hypothetical protein n=1 Tax=Bengtsoniella intestinalis TaxID=3073143 RepID=UPI00391EFED0